MRRNENRSLSPVTRVYAELQGMLTPNEFDRIVPLINSAVNSNDTNDTTTSFRRPQNVFEVDSMDTDPPAAAAAPAATASSLNSNRLDDIDTDAAIARQLQEDEYSRDSLAPHFRSNSRRNPTSTTSKSINRHALSDAEYAAQLQAEEEQNQRRNNPRRFVPSSNPPRTSNRANQSETIRAPVATNSSQHRPLSSRASNTDNNLDVTSLSQVLSMFQQNFAPRNPNGVHNLENTSEDFGPDDYENLLELDRSLPTTRLTENEINRLPIERFRPRAANKEEDNKCNICWDEFKLNEALRRLPCLHAYHQTCIDPWLKTNNTCPICRVATRLNQ